MQGFRKGLQPLLLTITDEAFDFIAQACRNTHPEEFIGLLRKNDKGIVDIVLLIPLSEFGHGFSSINFNMLPLNADYCGSVHSHPNGYAVPSKQDKLFFSKIGGVHLIMGAPYTVSNAMAYDDRGRRIPLKIV
jgi:proteasome lid subunit RPN8/RPN11